MIKKKKKTGSQRKGRKRRRRRGKKNRKNMKRKRIRPKNKTKYLLSFKHTHKLIETQARIKKKKEAHIYPEVKWFCELMSLAYFPSQTSEPAGITQWIRRYQYGARIISNWTSCYTFEKRPRSGK